MLFLAQLHAHFFKIIWQKFNIAYLLFHSIIITRGNLRWHLWIKTFMFFFRASLNPTGTWSFSLYHVLDQLMLLLLLLPARIHVMAWKIFKDTKPLIRCKKEAIYVVQNQNISAYNNLEKNNRHFNIIPKVKHWVWVKDEQCQAE